MYLTYLDESGDDGFPNTSSPLYVQSAVYLPHDRWKDCFERIQAFRRTLATQTKLAFSLELHTRELLLDKDPYHALRIPPAERHAIVSAFCRHFATLDVRVINVVIHKAAIVNESYPVLDRAITYLVQRIENDLRRTRDHFIVISDEGRVGKIRATTRRMQRFNPVPSKFGSLPQRIEIEYQIEDPLPKPSHESHFIQFADLVAYLVQLRMQLKLGTGEWPKRLRSYLAPDAVVEWLEILRPCFNLSAAPLDRYGIVCYPKAKGDPRGSP